MTWCQYHPSYNEHAAELWQRSKRWGFDTSHEISDVDGAGHRIRVACFKHADDAALVEQLVNAFREGRLMVDDSKERSDDG